VENPDLSYASVGSARSRQEVVGEEIPHPLSVKVARWDDEEWRLHAGCVGIDTLVFFPDGQGAAKDGRKRPMIMRAVSGPRYKLCHSRVG
jgi:hypothetical protein